MMTPEPFEKWFTALQGKRRRWVEATRENRGFDRGIWSATVNKYADPAHFVFELMQNAEDEGAIRVYFEIGNDAIIFEHNGGEFTRDDVDSITGIGNTTKLEERNKIGCFGIGFKSVYVVTPRPEIHTTVDGEPFAFAISDLVVPEIIPYQGTPEHTRFVLPLRAELRAALREQVHAQLTAAGPRALLFLTSLRELAWSDGSSTHRYIAEDKPKNIRVVSHRIGDELTGTPERYLILTRLVQEDGPKGPLAVKIALRLDGAGNIVAEPHRTKLAVFFETEEQTGLFFRLHGPFQLTDSRANMKRGDPWNDQLVDELAQLLSESLPALRDHGLVKRSLLGVLPNGHDELDPPWSKLFDATVAAFQYQSLVPAQNGGHEKAADLVQGPAVLREFLGDAGLQLLSQRPELRWCVSASQRNNREDHFLAALQIADWGLGEFLTAIQQLIGYGHHRAVATWIDGLDEEHLQRFYLLLDEALRVTKRSVHALIHLPLVRLESGKRVTPSAALLPPAAEAIDPEIGEAALPLVQLALLRGGRGRGKEVEQFLRRLGVKEVGERDYLKALLARHYHAGRAPHQTELHLRHMRRFLKWWRDHKDASLFSDAGFLRAETQDGYFEPDAIYLGAPYSKGGLDAIYDGTIPGRDRRPLWSGYQRLTREELVGFLTAVGVEDRLQITVTSIPWNHPHRSALHEGFPYYARHTNTGVSRDYTIEGLSVMLRAGRAEISGLIWKALSAARPEVMRACYTPNQTYAANYARSTLAVALATTPWIPASDGTFRRPSELTMADLAPGFSCQGTEHWLAEIGFGAEYKRRTQEHQERRHAAQIMGLPTELADRLAELSPEARAQLAEEIIRRIADGGIGRPAFPEKASPNPAQRAERIAGLAAAATPKTYEHRELSTRVSNGESQTFARTYLRDLYTNDDGEMVCQACHDEMPFRLADGSYYFEAVEFCDAVDREISENHLALCPVCAAKWRYANGSTSEALASMLLATDAPFLDLQLASRRARLRFVEKHFADLKSVLDATMPGSSAAPVVAAGSDVDRPGASL